MQSSMKNQRSSPASPCFFTSTRQALYLALLALHLAFISFSFSIVSFILDGLAVAGAVVVAAGAAAGAVVWAEAVWSVPATSSMAARQIPVRSIGKFPWGQFVELNGETKGAAGRTCSSRGPRDVRSEYLGRAFQRLPDTPGERNTDEGPEQ